MKAGLVALLTAAALAVTAVGAGDAGLSAVAGVPFERRDFAHSATIDNTWLPLEGGSEYVYTGSSADGRK